MTGGQARARAFHNRTLEPAEGRAYRDAPVTDAERDEVLTLVRWFKGRYRTPVERLAYVRRAYARWHRTLGIGTGASEQAER
jgi:hypothetical protein